VQVEWPKDLPLGFFGYGLEGGRAFEVLELAEAWLRDMNRYLGQRGLPTAPTRFAPSDPPSAVRRFSDAPDSPWRDATFVDALGYAQLPVKAPASGQLPAFSSNPQAPWSVWTSGVYTSFDRGGAAAIDGHVANVMGGLDYRLTDRWLVGAALGYEDQRFDTSFNAGNFRGRGATIGPYASYKLTPNLIANVFAGAAFLNYDVTATGATGSYHANRLFVSGSLVGTWSWERWRLSPRANLFYFSERRAGFTDSTGVVQPAASVNVGRVSVGPEVGYRFIAFDGRGLIEPTGFVALDCDLTSRAGIAAANGIVVTQSACGARIGSGLNVVAPVQGLSASIGVSYNSLFRADENSWTFQGRIGKQF
jgi:outer membrane autotransporter protein